MTYQHEQLASGRWYELNFFTQMANVGSEVIRAINWKQKGNQKYCQLAFERALELLDLTIDDQKNRRRLRELLRVRETWVDYFAFTNGYHSTDKAWLNYFNAFNYAARN